jgi:hypothetical protein
MDRAGRLQVPRAYVEKLGLGARVRLRLRDGYLEVSPSPQDGPQDGEGRGGD